MVQLLRDLRAYYQGYQGRDLGKFYDLESRLPYFDHAGWILGRHKRQVLLQWIRARQVQGPILELGSGIGTFARQLASRGYDVVAIDISATKTAKARHLSARRWPGQLSPVQHFRGDLVRLGTGTSLDQEIQQACQAPLFPRFNVLLAADVLEHVPQPPSVTVAHLHTLLAPQGRLFVTVPSRFCLHDPGHIWKLLPDEWEHIFVEHGFRVQQRRMSRLCWYGFPTPLPLAMVYELHANTAATQCLSTAAHDREPWQW